MSVFCFLLFPSGTAVPGLTTRGWTVPTVLNEATGAGKDTQGSCGSPLPLNNMHLVLLASISTM